MTIIKKEDLKGIAEKAYTVFGELDFRIVKKDGIEADVYTCPKTGEIKICTNRKPEEKESDWSKFTL